MGPYVHKHFKGSRIIAFVVMVSILLPMVSWASPVLQGEIVKYSEVQNILSEFEQNFPKIITNPKWGNESSENGELLFVLENWSSKFPEFRLKMSQNNAGNFDMFLQKKKNSAWVKYLDGRKIGQVIYTDNKKVKYSPEISTYENGQGYNLLEQLTQYGLKVQDEDGNIHDNGSVLLSAETVKKRQEILKAEQRLLRFQHAKLQCDAVLKDEDVRQRDLVAKVFGIRGDQQTTFPESELDEFKNQIEIGVDEVNVIESIKTRMLDLSLDFTMYSYFAFREAYIGKRTSGEWVKFFYNSENFPTYIQIHPKFKDSMIRMYGEYSRYKALAPSTDVNLYTETQNLNRMIANVNSTCEAARKECRIGIACDQHQFAAHDDPASVKMHFYKSNAKISSAKHELKTKYEPKLNELIEQIQSSKLYVLFGSEDFRDDIGTIDINECISGDDQLKKTDSPKVIKALADVSDLYREKIKEIVRGFDVAVAKRHMPGQVTDIVKTYMNSLPVTAMMTLEQKKNPHEVKVVCGLINDQYENDQIVRYIDWGLIGLGLVAGVILGATGVGAPAGVAMIAKTTATATMIGVNIAAVGVGVAKLSEGNRLEDQVSKAIITKEIKAKDAVSDLQKHAARQIEGIFDVGGTVLGEGLGYGIGRSIRYYSAAKTTAAKVFFESQDAVVTKSIHETLYQPKYAPLKQKKAFEILEEAQKNGFKDSENLISRLEAAGIEHVDANNMLYQLATLNDQKIIFQHVESILTQPKHVGKSDAALRILHGVSTKGSVMRGVGDVYYNSHARIVALQTARKELVKLGYDIKDVDHMLDDLFNEVLGKLRGTVEPLQNGKFGAYSTRHPETIDFEVDGRLRVLPTVDEAKHLIKHEYVGPEDFFKIRDQFKKGGTIKFKNGKVFSIKGIYDDTGSRNTILELDSGRLLRVAKKNSFGMSDSPEAFVTGQSVLESAGFPVVRVFESSQDYVLVEKISNSRNIRNYQHYLLVRDKLHEVPEFAKLAREKMDADFLKFAEKTKNIEHVGNFRAEEIVYSDHRGWVVVDFGDDIRVYNGKGNMTVFESDAFNHLPEGIQEQAIQTVRNARGPKIEGVPQTATEIQSRVQGVDDQALLPGSGSATAQVKSESLEYFSNLSGNQGTAFKKVQNEILLKPEYSPIDQNKVLNILYKAHKTGSIVEVRPGVFRPDSAKNKALKEAKKELQMLGYSQEDTNQIIARLSHKDVMVLGAVKSVSSLPEATMYLKSELNINVADFYARFGELNAEYHIVRFAQIMDRISYAVGRSSFKNFFANNQQSNFADLVGKVSDASEGTKTFRKKFDDNDILELMKVFGSSSDYTAYTIIDDIIAEQGYISPTIYSRKFDLDFDIKEQMSPVQRKIISILQSNVDAGKRSLYGLEDTQIEIVKKLIAEYEKKPNPIRLFGLESMSRKETEKIKILTSGAEPYRWGKNRIFEVRPEMKFAYDNNKVLLIFDVQQSFVIPDLHVTKFEKSLVFSTDGFWIDRVEVIDGVDHIYLKDSPKFINAEFDPSIGRFVEGVFDDVIYAHWPPAMDYFYFGISPDQRVVLKKLEEEILKLEKYKSIDTREVYHILYEVRMSGPNVTSVVGRGAPTPEKMSEIKKALEKLKELGFEKNDAQKILARLATANII